MSARIAHRGPDGEGIHLNHEEEVRPDRPQVGLAFRRLAILDPDPRAMQPFTDRDGRWMVFNGEIYNFRELRAELSKIHPDYQWRTNGDTEVLLQSYATWGEACLERLNGMYAIAIWDEPKKQLFMARDRMGQKPLYYSRTADGAIAFASELSAITTLPWIDKTIGDQSVAHYLSWGYTGAPRTIYRNIHAMCPSAFMSVARADLSEQQPRLYFDANGRSPTSDPVAETRRLLLQATQRQIVSDVPIGCFLSGGVDSSITAAAMTRAAGPGGDVQTFSIGFDDPRYDERSYAERIAQHLGTRHRGFVVKPDAATDLPKLAEVFGEPFGDSSALPTHYLARETRDFVKVALSGDGGDELFGGYDRYRAMILGERMRHMPHFVHELFWMPFSLGLIRQTHPKSRSARAARFMSSVRMGPARRYSKYVRMFDEPIIQELLRGGWPRKDRRVAERDIIGAFRQFLRNGRDVVQSALALDRVTYLPEDLLTKVDRASMLHALEVRSPYMDHELVQFAAGLSTDQLLKGGPKRMLREAFAADLPAWVFKRRKMGFAVPIGEWFRGELRSMLHDHLFAGNSFAASHFNKPAVQRLVDEHEQERADHSQRLYALLMLELWWKTQG